MRSLLPWACAVLLPASAGFAQEPTTTKPAVTRPAVKIVFAPDYSRAGQSPEARILDAIAHGLLEHTPAPVEFAAPGGMTAVSLGPEHATVSMMSAGPDGKLRFECVPLSTALQNLKRTGSTRNMSATEAGNDR